MNSQSYSQIYGQFRLDIDNQNKAVIEFLPTEERYSFGKGVGTILDDISPQVLETVCVYLDSLEMNEILRDSLWDIYLEALRVQEELGDVAN